MGTIALYIKLGKRLRATIRELGYPTKNVLKGRFLRPRDRLSFLGTGKRGGGRR